MKSLVVKNLHASVDDKPILKGIDLTIKPGEIHALMGPNGSGKSTLAYALAGHPHYQITKGSVSINGKDITDESPDERALLGLFLAFQYPVTIEGVSVQNMLWQAFQTIYPKRAKKMSVLQFRKHLQNLADVLEIDASFLSRYLNDGFSGGEKKRVEIIQMLALEPKYAIFDETDSGLDIDSIKLAAQGIHHAVKEYKSGAIIITHYQRILKYVKPDYVHVVIDGKIQKTGDHKVVEELEKKGYKQWIQG